MGKFLLVPLCTCFASMLCECIANLLSQTKSGDCVIVLIVYLFVFFVCRITQKKLWTNFGEIFSVSTNSPGKWSRYKILYLIPQKIFVQHFDRR